MSFDDYSSPATPFSGDPTGDIFSAPDVVHTSATTTERVVDTQSGFLVVVKNVDAKLALSVKRRIGTPPVSSILLTPDEALKLSNILAVQPAQPSGLFGAISPSVDSWLNEVDEKLQSQPASHRQDRANIVERSRTRRRSAAPIKISRTKIFVALACLISIPVIGFAAFKLTSANPGAIATSASATDLENARVDKFARAFVADMLDFNPETYRVSQVHAMASMSPELLNRYWAETRFPLTLAQLKASPQGMTLMITKVTQQRLSDQTRDVDIFAELVSADSKVSSPVHLKLQVGPAEDGQWRILSQKDLSARK